MKQSTTLDVETKKKVEPLMKADYMSSDESITLSDQSDEEMPLKHRKFIKHVATWRSAEFQEIIDSLDRKINRRRSDKSKSMVIPVEIGEPSTRAPPEECPDWAAILL